MLDFSDAKPDEAFLCRDGHIATNIHCEGEGVYRHLCGTVKPKAGSVYEKIGVKLMEWQMNGRIRSSLGSSKSGFDLVQKISNPNEE